MTSTPGWFGKVPSLGDFASRRLPDTFIAPWDSWLQHGMAESRATLGDRWLDVYMTSPIWRFALMPGVLETGAWAGIMMPSIDKVGRHFPLTIAVEVPLRVGDDATRCIVGALDWFAGIEQVALSALDAGTSAADFDDKLSAIAFPVPLVEAVDDPALDPLVAWWQGAGAQPYAFEVASEPAIASMHPSLTSRIFAVSAAGKSLWWSRATESGSFEVNWMVGLPPERYFAALLLGIQWRRSSSTPSVSAPLPDPPPRDMPPQP